MCCATAVADASIRTQARPILAASAASLLIALVPSTATIAAPYDFKGVSASICQPYAPDTTSAQIQVTQSGIYSPGTTIEKVICAMPREYYAVTSSRRA